MSFIFYLLCAHDEVLKKVLDEINSIANGDKEYIPKFDDLAKVILSI